MTAATFNADALEFFEENQEFVASYGLSNLERSERILFNKGRRLVEQAIADAAKRSAKRVPYTDEQTQFIADAYLATEGDRDSVVSAFVREFRFRSTSIIEVEHRRSHLMALHVYTLANPATPLPEALRDQTTTMLKQLLRREMIDQEA